MVTRTIAHSDAKMVRRPQEERSADTRQRLIAAATEMIAQMGYAATTTTTTSIIARYSRAELASVLHIIMAAMRGSAIAFMAGRSSANFGAEREQLRRMALAAFQNSATGEAK